MGFISRQESSEDSCCMASTSLKKTPVHPPRIQREDFPVNPSQLHGRMAIRFGKMSLLGEVGLLPIFDESPLDTPGMQSFQWVCSTDSAIDNGALKVGICELWLHRSVGTA